MNKIITLALIASCMLSCKKENTNTGSNATGTSTLKYNPDGCSIVDMHQTANNVRTLTRRDYFRGETLDSTIFYLTNGSISAVVYWNSYSASYQEGVNMNAQRKITITSFTWFDENRRAIRQKAELPNGSVSYDNTYDYSCQ